MIFSSETPWWVKLSVVLTMTSAVVGIFVSNLAVILVALVVCAVSVGALLYARSTDRL